ncbi:MAG: hypothetical protein CMO49_00710 [Verrucomicrobiales bacterium]|nr:hypothetical protein [Verrucomicrobiales bacterium]MEC7224802.1 hypothetical protein [Verrucomicrobiota bacterium]MEC8659950.1 hypothetical protein [Verrucomicrobiota bacterium]|tara:strand:- start:45 stop:572 length:528 start_codon:yes stop_codon:yes gene_type:complete
MTKLVLLLFAFLSISPCVFSQNDNNQNNSSSEQIPSRFWKATLPGGEYMVALNSISSIAKHTYIVDGAARVFEVTVADKSSAIARFYFIEPVTDSSPINAGQVVLDRLKSVTKEASERLGAGDVWDQVIKNYPSSTHAKTVEFRLSVKSNIDSIYSSIARAWERGRGENFKVVTK